MSPHKHLARIIHEAAAPDGRQKTDCWIGLWRPEARRECPTVGVARFDASADLFMNSPG